MSLYNTVDCDEIHVAVSLKTYAHVLTFIPFRCDALQRSSNPVTRI